MSADSAVVEEKAVAGDASTTIPEDENAMLEDARKQSASPLFQPTLCNMHKKGWSFTI